MNTKKIYLVCGGTSELGQKVCKNLKDSNSRIYIVDKKMLDSCKLETYKYPYDCCLFFDLSQQSSWDSLAPYGFSDVYFLLKNDSENELARNLCIKFCQENKILNMVTLDNLHYYINLGPS